MSTTCSASRRASYLVLRMHVVVASHQPLPAKGYGGPQRVVVALVRGLAALGHRVTLLAPPTTRVPEATVVAVPPRKLTDPATLAPYVPRDAAIVHTHFPLRSAPGSYPFVQTVHRNLKPGGPSYPNSIFLSRDHARRHNSDVFVYNGLDPADYVFRRFPRRPSQYDLFLGALHSAKGYHWAVEAAKRSGHRLIVAGGWRPSFTGSIKFVGEVDGTTKAALLARARCLWNPAAWDEPFGLVTIEAFFSGRPGHDAQPDARDPLADGPPMHIVQFHHVRLPVFKYGGGERIVVWLCQGLVERGHQVTLLAPKGSRIAGVRVVEVSPEEVLSPGFDVRRYVSEPVDIMHFHCPLRYPPPGIPSVWTLQGNMGDGRRADARTICVSEDHARRHGTHAFVRNGARLDEYEFRAAKGDYDLFLARLHSVKGWQVAIAAAKRCRVRLTLAGGWRPTFSRYVRFVGQVGGVQKRELLAGARCLWMPVRWEDPCPINILEALASGTPIIGSPRGSLPELISPDTGGLGTSLEELVALRGRLAEWDPHACRARAERSFSHLVMTDEYIRMYRSVLETGTLPPGRPTP